MPASASARGIDAALLLLMLLAALGLLGLAFSSCSMKSSDRTSPLSSPEDEEEDDDDEEDDKGKNLGLLHPKKATAWDTRVYVMTQPQPPHDKIATCFEQITAIATDAENQDALVTAQGQASALVGEDLALWHACFYHLVVKLDERMEAGGPLMEDLATAFFDGMRRLWILARALDANVGRERYMAWLTKRYVQMSREYFGRSIEVVAPPMSNMPQKPAGSSILD